MPGESSSEIQRVISGDLSFLERLRTDVFTGSVHSVFRHVVNLQDTQGELHTLACRACDDAPNTLRLGADELNGDSFVVGDACFGVPEKSILCFSSGVTVRYAQATPWQCRLPAYPLHNSYWQDKIGHMESALKQDALRPSASGSLFQLTVQAMLQEKLERLFHLLLRNDFLGATECAVGIIGLGPGLTPSGDDVLTGLFAMLNIDGSPALHLRSLCGNVLEQATSRTNAISLAALKAAAGGKVRQSIVDLIGNIFDGKAALDEAVLARVLQIGSSSGRDILTGLLCGLRLAEALSLQETRGMPEE